MAGLFPAIPIVGLSASTIGVARTSPAMTRFYALIQKRPETALTIRAVM
jgi:hypothetical protein